MIRCSRHHAFTLLELILAAAIVASLGLTLATAMSIGFRARRTAQAQVDAVRDASIVMELVQQDLQSVLPPTGVLAGSFIGYAMGTTGAEADSLEFHTLGRDAGDTSPMADGMRRVQLVLRTDTTPPTLVRRVQRNLLASTQEPPVEEPLSRSVRAFAVRYYDGSGWSQEWDSTLQDNALPVALQITLVFDTPSPTDSTRPYRLTALVPLSCGRPVDSAAFLGVPLE